MKKHFLFLLLWIGSLLPALGDLKGGLGVFMGAVAVSNAYCLYYSGKEYRESDRSKMAKFRFAVPAATGLFLFLFMGFGLIKIIHKDIPKMPQD